MLTDIYLNCIIYTRFLSDGGAGLKKSVCFMLVIALLFASGVTVFAAEKKNPPEADNFTYKKTAEDIYFSLSCAVSEDIYKYEEQRTQTLDKLREELTDEQIQKSDYAFLLYPTEISVVCDIGGTDYFIKNVSTDTEKISFTLFDDVFPSLADKNALTEDILDSGTLELYLTVTAFDGTERYCVSEKTELEKIVLPKCTYIEYILPEGTKNDNPVFMFTSDTDIKLLTPTRDGYTFAGWQMPDGSFVGEIPADTIKMTVTATWDDIEYAVKYVLSTREGYSFMRVDNSANPTKYTPREGAKLYSPSAPIGYCFGYWADPEGKEVSEIPKGSSGDKILYAVWFTESEYKAYKAKAEHWFDVDNDGDVSVADARIVLRAAVNIEPLSKTNLARVDLAGQGRADVAIARLVLRVAVKLDELSEVVEAYGKL